MNVNMLCEIHFERSLVGKCVFTLFVRYSFFCVLSFGFPV